MIQLASYSFDVFVEEVFPLLLAGGKLLLQGQMDVGLLAGLILKHKVNIVDCTPLLLNEFNKIVSTGLPDNPLANIHTFISGGDVLKKEYVDNLLKIGNVYNTYGPTESTVCVSYYRYTGENEQSETLPVIPIGKPIANDNIYILDGISEPVPIGVTGELCVAGDGVTRGYLNNPELTAARFSRGATPSTTLPIPTAPFTLLYRTGDLARWKPDGNIEFLGRKDEQVKIRGYRIETGEIENRLLQYEHIEGAVVIVNKDKDGDKHLCAYIVSGEAVDLSGLKESLTTKMPDYMVPSFFMQIDRVPLTSNGKTDRKALPEPEIIAGVKYAAPQNTIQEDMQKIWQEVLGLECIGINDNFFAIGGHSLKGIRVVNEIHKALNIKLPLAEIFKTPTIKGLAAFIEDGVKDEYISIPPAEKKEYYP
ncbi:MAG: AMP-binding protein, partial [bacterium]|nr:AMP-binding protein [bacterium]